MTRDSEQDSARRACALAPSDLLGVKLGWKPTAGAVTLAEIGDGIRQASH